MHVKDKLRFVFGEKFYVFLSEKVANPLRKAKYLLMGKEIVVYCKKVKGLKYYGDETYGGYVIYDKYLCKDSIVYSCGIGENTSFDDEIIKRKKCQVYAFDPDPMAIRYVKENKRLNNNFHFYPYAVIAKGGEECMFFCDVKTKQCDGSGSVYNIDKMGEKMLVQSKSILQLMKMFGHQHIDILKLDIEGAEYELISELVVQDVEIDQITMEVHGKMFDKSRKKNKKLCLELKKNGYAPIYCKYGYGTQDVTFIKKDILVGEKFAF